jgi:hypothetical protein
MAIRSQIPLWVPEGVHDERELTSTNGKLVWIDYFPYKMYNLDVKNLGPDDAKIMVNEQALPNASTLIINERRNFDAQHPAYWRISLYSAGAATIRVTATR